MIGTLILSFILGLAEPATPFEFKDGDRVVLLGDTFIERDQQYGYLESLITSANPDKAITFRNLGWSGDTVTGIARARFGTEADGFAHLKEDVLALKPTVLMICYGMNESFAGEAGLPKFVAGLNHLLDELKPANARIILISPIAHEQLDAPLPDPKKHNAELARYTRAIADVATSRGARFVDLFTPTSARMAEDRRSRAHFDSTVGRLRPAQRNEIEPLRAGMAPLTTDGIHLTQYGYWHLARIIAESLGPMPPARAFKSELPLKPPDYKISARDPELHVPPPPGPVASLMPPAELLTFVIPDLPAGDYSLKIDGLPAKTASAQEWAAGSSVQRKIDPAPAEALRAAINAKNELYFHRWRPQNETYLFLFRKHEQGNNAREMPMFDPLVEAKEREIAKLKIPPVHTYELVRKEAGR